MTPQQFKSVREKLGLSIEEIAQIIGVHWTSIYRYESGSRKIIPPVELIINEIDPEYKFKIADAVRKIIAERKLK